MNGNVNRATSALERPSFGRLTGMDFVVLDGDTISRRLYVFVENPDE
jgi:phosphoribosyl-dephospho-CoA transferase